MTDRSLAIRLAVIDGGKVKAELREVGDAGHRSLKRIEDAARPASRALQALDGVSSDVRGSLEAMNGRLGAVGSGLARLGPIGLAAGAALAGVGLALTRGIEEAAKADQSYRRLEAVLKATGYAAGLTAKEISAFSDGIEASTLATAEGVQDAAAILATFRSVSGETFTRALSLAQDMAAVFGQDLSSAATQLGKALEDPIDGLTALRRVGISFTDSQKELIKTLVETGQTADAQRVILDALERQVGGAGAAEAGGLTGATNRLQDAWGNLLEAIGRTPAVSGLAEQALGALSTALEGVRAWFEDDPLPARIERTTRQLGAARDELARLQAGGPGTPLLGQRFAQEEQQQRIDALAAELTTLEGIAGAEAQAAQAEKQRAEAGRRAAEIERQAELAAERQRQAAEAAGPRALRPGEAAPRRSTGGGAARVDTDRRLIDSLARDLGTIGDDRQRSVDQALSRLSAQATAVQRAEVERLAGALYDEKQAREQAADAMRAEERLREEGARLTEAMRTPAEALTATLERYDALLAAGAIDQETWNRAVAEAGGAFDLASEAARGFTDITTNALQASEGAFVAWATTGKLAGRDLFSSLAEDALRLAYRLAVIRPLQGLFDQLQPAILSGFSAAGNFIAGLFHDGGVVGAAGYGRLVPALAFAGAPRLHGGGVLHCIQGAGVVFQGPRDLITGGWRIEGFYRFIGDAPCPAP